MIRSDRSGLLICQLLALLQERGCAQEMSRVVFGIPGSLDFEPEEFFKKPDSAFADEDVHDGSPVQK